MTQEIESNFDELAPGAGKQTLLKTTLRNQIDLVSITDQKANMLLSINAIILSIVISLAGTRMVVNLNDYLDSPIHAIPAILLLLSCLGSGILCIYAATPRRRVDKGLTDDIGILLLTTKENITNADEFLTELNRILKSNDLIYKNMSLDIYNLGSLLTKKYKLLRFAYYTFFFGITVTVILFIILIFF